MNKDDFLLSIEIVNVNADDAHCGCDNDLVATFDVNGAAEIYCQALRNVENAFKNSKILDAIRELVDLPIQ